MRLPDEIDGIDEAELWAICVASRPTIKAQTTIATVDMMYKLLRTGFNSPGCATVDVVVAALNDRILVFFSLVSLNRESKLPSYGAWTSGKKSTKPNKTQISNASLIGLRRLLLSNALLSLLSNLTAINTISPISLSNLYNVLQPIDLNYSGYCCRCCCCYCLQSNSLFQQDCLGKSISSGARVALADLLVDISGYAR